MMEKMFLLRLKFKVELGKPVSATCLKTQT